MTDPFPAETDLFPTLGRWQPPRAWIGRLAERAHLADWLTLDDSLSKALRAACGGTFALRIHDRCRVALPPGAADLLDRPAGEEVAKREVFLQCDGADVVFARSWIPDGVLADPGEYPLGDRLFDPDSGLRRLRLEAAPVAGPEGETLWARRSLHETQTGRLLVGEVFLPAMDSVCP
ncbi:chorismate--pyruvate lyase family protein [Thiohalorhabdus sp.]|uniref:chorismate--pyruvate lyase family protein n=1 Tax=Thiohalorhabdus sp. TaxID=3094134 RepID=UPI002FC3B94E